MTDIAPELWEKISAEFEATLKNDKEITRLYEKIRSGKASYEEAQVFSQRVGKLSSMALTDNITAEALPDGKMYFNIAERTVRPALERDYELISDVSAEVQTSLNEAAGIGMNPVIPEMNEDRVSGLIDKLTEDGKAFDDVRSFLEDPVMNFCQNIVDESVRANAEMHYASGLTPKIKRIMTGHKACGFCIERAGEHKYPLPDNRIYQRHENCRCLVLYDPGNGKYQDVHSKIEYKSVREAADARKEELRQQNEDKFRKKKNLARDKGERFVDATNYWNNKPKEYPAEVVDTPKKFTYKGTEYEQDGVHIFIDKDESAEEMRQILCSRYGGVIERFPQIQEIDKNHPAQKTPDFLWNGFAYDAKKFEKGNKNKECFYNAIAPKREQAKRFVVDISDSGLSKKELYYEAERMFTRKSWLEQIVIIENNNVSRILERI